MVRWHLLIFCPVLIFFFSPWRAIDNERIEAFFVLLFQFRGRSPGGEIKTKPQHYFPSGFFVRGVIMGCSTCACLLCRATTRISIIIHFGWDRERSLPLYTPCTRGTMGKETSRWGEFVFALDNCVCRPQLTNGAYSACYFVHCSTSLTSPNNNS